MRRCWNRATEGLVSDFMKERGRVPLATALVRFGAFFRGVNLPERDFLPRGRAISFLAIDVCTA